MAEEVYCNVAVPVPLPTTFTYRVPPSWIPLAQPGCRVHVPFRNRSLVGMLVGLSAEIPKRTPIKEIAEVLDASPILTPTLLRLGQWIAEYYLAPPGEVFEAMLPLPAELRTKRLLRLTEAGCERIERLRMAEVGDRPRAELALLEALSSRKDGMSLQQAQTRIATAGELLPRLIRVGAIEQREVVRRRKARTEMVVAWIGAGKDSALLGGAAATVGEYFRGGRGPAARRDLMAATGVKRSAVARLVRAGWLSAWQEPIVPEAEPLEFDFDPSANILNADQQAAVEAIGQMLERREFATSLLYGVTGSGKTEVYLRAIQMALERGGTALLMVPEIALTPAAARLLRAKLGPTVAVLHSAMPESARGEEWWRLRRGEARVAVGTRSAVFAPVENLQLIIVDEEQDSSYKQEETPKYNGRDVAVVRGKLEGATVVLGSATPALETFMNAGLGKYRLLQLKARVADRPLAQVEIVDMREEYRASPRITPLSRALEEAIEAELAAGNQAVVLMNRRGYSWFVLCRSCGSAVQCQNCSISLTYHKARNRLLCHYCGFQKPVPKSCPKCQAEYIYFVGEGAERVEERLRERFPLARIARLDRDSVRGKRRYHAILSAFARGKLDILVGTQMVAKGHDFQRVTLVGVVSADLILGLPDFRAGERTFQILTQVAGRAGRGDLPGKVLVQTYFPDHYAIQFGVAQDYEGFYRKESEYRRIMHYPPFVALASILVRSRRVEEASRVAQRLSEFLEKQEQQGIKVLGPAAAPIARLRSDYRIQFLLKALQRKILIQALHRVLSFCQKAEISSDKVLIDVDPLSLM